MIFHHSPAKLSCPWYRGTVYVVDIVVKLSVDFASENKHDC